MHTSDGHAPISFWVRFISRDDPHPIQVVVLSGSSGVADERWNHFITQCSVCGWTKDTLTGVFFLLFTREDTTDITSSLLWFRPCAMLLADGPPDGSNHALVVL